jgi:hypothetical protein
MPIGTALGPVTGTTMGPVTGLKFEDRREHGF